MKGAITAFYLAWAILAVWESIRLRRKGQKRDWIVCLCLFLAAAALAAVYFALPPGRGLAEMLLAAKLFA